MQINKYTKITLNSCQKYRRYDRRICYETNLFLLMTQKFYFVFAKVDLITCTYMVKVTNVTKTINIYVYYLS